MFANSDCSKCLQFSSFGKDIQPEHVREDSGLEMDSPESRFASLSGGRVVESAEQQFYM